MEGLGRFRSLGFSLAALMPSELFNKVEMQGDDW